MNSFSKTKANFTLIIISKLLIAALLIGLLSSFLAISLKQSTEYFEKAFFLKAEGNWIYLLFFPTIGLTLIYFLRQYLFKQKANKGITEIFDVTQSKSKNLPLYKIPSHFINGLLTVAFGGSTGIEVSTVVATAAIGNTAQRKEKVLSRYKTELICAGITAGITILFGSPIAGLLFSAEVITKKINRVFIITNGIALMVALAILSVLDEKPLFHVAITTWHLKAIPYFIVLGLLAGLHSVYLTKSVLFFKSLFRQQSHWQKILFGGVILSICLILYPELYGDGYHAIESIFSESGQVITSTLTLIGIILLKPLITSATLVAGGDGGVFAPSLFIGAFLGFLTATLLNTFFATDVIVINFVILGMAAVLSASIHAPFTALFLVCGMIADYTLFFPLLLVCFVAKYAAKMVFPYTVYNYSATQ